MPVPIPRRLFSAKGLSLSKAIPRLCDSSECAGTAWEGVRSPHSFLCYSNRIIHGLLKHSPDGPIHIRAVAQLNPTQYCRRDLVSRPKAKPF